jgi:hypothetical protein
MPTEKIFLGEGYLWATESGSCLGLSADKKHGKSISAHWPKALYETPKVRLYAELVVNGPELPQDESKAPQTETEAQGENLIDSPW